MFRVTVLSIVLALPVSQNAGLCRAWCDEHAPAAAGCHHERSTPSLSVAGDESCDDVMFGALALVPDDVRRGVTPVESTAVIPAPRSHVDVSTVELRSGQFAKRRWPPGNKPLQRALRL